MICGISEQEILSWIGGGTVAVAAVILFFFVTVQVLRLANWFFEKFDY